MSKATPLTDAFFPAGLERFVKHIGDVEGRDKMAKAVQYGSRLLMYHFLKQDNKNEFGLRMQGLANIMGSARKLGRLFKTLNEYQKLLNALDSDSPAYKQALEVFNKFMMGWYWFFDNIGWFCKGKVLKYDEKSVSWYAGVGWFSGMSSSLVLALLKLFENYQKEAKLTKIIVDAKSDSDVTKSKEDRKKVLDARLAIVLSAFKSAADAICAGNTIDVWVNVLGYKLNDGVIGTVGLSSAMIASYMVFNGMK